MHRNIYEPDFRREKSQSVPAECLECSSEATDMTSVGIRLAREMKDGTENARGKMDGTPVLGKEQCSYLMVLDRLQALNCTGQETAQG